MAAQYKAMPVASVMIQTFPSPAGIDHMDLSDPAIRGPIISISIILEGPTRSASPSPNQAGRFTKNV